MGGEGAREQGCHRSLSRRGGMHERRRMPLSYGAWLPRIRSNSSSLASASIARAPHGVTSTRSRRAHLGVTTFLEEQVDLVQRFPAVRRPCRAGSGGEGAHDPLLHEPGRLIPDRS